MLHYASMQPRSGLICDGTNALMLREPLMTYVINNASSLLGHMRAHQQTKRCNCQRAKQA